MRIGFRAKIFLAVCGPAAIGIAMAVWFHGGLLALLAAAIAAFASASFLSAAVANHVAQYRSHRSAIAPAARATGERARDRQSAH